jgi:dCMP deaminase
MKEKLKHAYMQTAETFAELSHARRLHVGAIVVKDDRIISIGYNGMPAGWDNNCEDREYTYDERDTGSGDWTYNKDTKQWSKLKTKPEVLHAETNAIAKLAKSTESGDGSVLFVTHSPCLDCAKLIFQSGIRSVFYRNSYRSTDGTTFLERSGVTVEQIEK